MMPVVYGAPTPLDYCLGFKDKGCLMKYRA